MKFTIVVIFLHFADLRCELRIKKDTLKHYDPEKDIVLSEEKEIIDSNKLVSSPIELSPSPVKSLSPFPSHHVQSGCGIPLTF